MPSRTHLYYVGQAVQVERLPRGERAQAFEIVRRPPADEAGGPQYRIQGLAVPIERVVCEVDIGPFEPWVPAEWRS